MKVTSSAAKGVNKIQSHAIRHNGLYTMSTGIGMGIINEPVYLPKTHSPVTITAISVSNNQTVAAGDTIFLYTHNDQSHELVSPHSGVLNSLRVNVGDAVNSTYTALS